MRTPQRVDPPGAAEPAVVRPRWSRGDSLATAGVFALALALRVAFLLASDDRAWPHSLRYEGDAPVWARWAEALGRSTPFEFDLPVRTPGVAFLLHALGLGDAPFTAAKMLWCVASAATCAGLWALLARFASRRAAWIGALWLALSNTALQLATSLNNEALYALLVVALLALHLASRERPRLASALVAGALHGAALLLRAEHLLLLALLATHALLESRTEGERLRAQAKRWALALAALLAVCAPWVWRSHLALARFNREAPALDYARAQPPWTQAARDEFERLPAFARAGNFAFLTHLAQRSGAERVDAADVRAYFEREWGGYVPEPLPEWTLVSSKGALDFALANHPEAGGGFSRAALDDGRDAAPEFSFGRPSHLRLYLHGYTIGLAGLCADPARGLRNVGAKLARFGAGVGAGLGADNWPHGAASVRRAVDLSTAQAPLGAWSGLVLALCAAGAWRGRRAPLGRALLLVVLYKLSVCVAFYGYARQAASIGPVWCALGALALDPLVAFVRARVGRTGSRLLLAGVVLWLAAPAASVARPSRLTPRSAPGAARAAPQWGAEAFEHPAELELDSLTGR